MMSGFTRKLTAATVALSLVAVPTSAIAASSAAPPATPVAQQAPSTASNQWMALSAMTTSSGAANAAAAQDDGGPGFPPIAPLAVILATIALAIWILVHDDGDEDLNLPVSP